MSEIAHVYTSPRATNDNAVPAGVVSYLDGHDLLAKIQAVQLSTVDADGWTRAVVIHAGDALMLPDGRLRFAIVPESRTATNLMCDGRVTLSLWIDSGVCELRMRARPLRPAHPQVPLALFEARVVQVRHQSAPYADMISGYTFTLHDPEAVLARWQGQIAALRAAA